MLPKSGILAGILKIVLEQRLRALNKYLSIKEFLTRRVG